MKALLLHEPNTWQTMRLEEIETPTLRAGEVLIEGEHAGLNPVDYKTATNGNPNWSYPHILGLDVAGTIKAVADDVTDVRIGDRVLYHGNWNEWGGFAEYTRAKAHMVVPIPDGVSTQEAAALPTAGFTAYQAIFEKLPMNAIDTVLIHAGAGGVGGFAIQLAKHLGKRVITTASARNHDWVKQLGADEAIDYTTENWQQRVMELTDGHGVNAVIDPVGRETATASLHVIAYNGHLVHIAGAPEPGIIKPFTRVISYHEVALNAIHHQQDRISEANIVRIGSHMLRLLEAKEISSMIQETIAFADIPEKLVELSERHVVGKIIADLKA
ncbi:zinc-binding dehydrogenase [Exiguobacterium sp. SL-9]|uniref:zinc-binding dehydrogenase n=1 Tax=Exiguobacterium sp. SL-9 TaxID=2510963 RepID=UPI00103CE349|nr:zinc-binding dehydrogenase [Exiguobacterium sp. SL-9]TCI20493.1 zinc-binding alcohol dehydrogenase [Exiguobacterium sp. SL-9]